MLKSYRNIIRSVYSTSGQTSTSSEPLTDFKSLLNYRYRMIAKQKQKYDGRSKKRQWEERRSETEESATPDTKITRIEEQNTEPVAEKIKRRKFCLMLGYSGLEYYGMQRNPKTKTIEEELLKALFKVGYINELCYNQVQNMQFQRAARTDKGVSAARQIVSLKLLESFNSDIVNAELPDDIRIFGFKRVTKGFNSKSQCDSRTYTYMLPTVAFADSKQISQKDFRIGDEKLKKIDELLQNFVGTKNFHNYTSKKKPNDPSANRYMKYFHCETPFVRNDVEFVILKVQGQSFMLHQIRKMVGMLLAVARGQGSVETMQNSFKPEKINIPRAPGLGLVLDYVHYDRYNHRYGEDGMHDKLTWEEVEDKVKDFKEKYIYPTIIDKEVNEEQMVYWLQNKLSRHSYDEEENESDDEGGDDDDDDENKINNMDCDKTVLDNKM